MISMQIVMRLMLTTMSFKRNDDDDSDVNDDRGMNNSIIEYEY